MSRNYKLASEILCAVLNKLKQFNLFSGERLFSGSSSRYSAFSSILFWKYMNALSPFDRSRKPAGKLLRVNSEAVLLRAVLSRLRAS